MGEPVMMMFQEKTRGKAKEKQDVDLSKKCLLTLEEAALYTGIGINKLREISNREDCDFILWNGSKRLLKRMKLEAYLNAAYSI